MSSLRTVPETVVHRALASPARARVLELLRAADAPMSVQELADAVDLHPNTARNHLAILENAQLVGSEPRRTAGPGRPHLVYAARAAHPPGVGSPDAGAVRLLTDLLAARVRTDHPDTERVVEDAAVALGLRLVAEEEPPCDEREVLGRLVASLAELGFDPRLEGDLVRGVDVVVERCPFASIARDHPQVACSFHRGLTRGVLDGLGERLELQVFAADPATGHCRASLRRTA